MNFFQQITDFVDTSVGGGVDFNDVHEAAFGDATTDFTFIAGLAIDGMFAIQRFGEDPGGAGFAGTPGTAEEVSVDGAPPEDGVFQHPDIILLSDKGFEILGPPFAVQC